MLPLWACGEPHSVISSVDLPAPLAPIIIQQIFDIIEQLRKDGVTVFLVEQNANQALKIADRAYVLENGRVVMQGTGEALLTDPKVREAYLGG